jgi:hypothetical protein
VISQVMLKCKGGAGGKTHARTGSSPFPPKRYDENTTVSAGCFSPKPSGQFKPFAVESIYRVKTHWNKFRSGSNEWGHGG